MTPPTRTNRHQPKAYGYLRVSTDSQAESGLGLEAQRAAVEASAQRQGIALADVFTDSGLSGSLDIEDRPGLFAAVPERAEMDWQEPRA